MAEIIGVKCKNVSKIYYFDPGALPIHYGEHVIVETVKGLEYGTVVLSPMDMEEAHVPQPVKPVIRIATDEDTERETNNRQREKDAYRICKQKIAERGLEMKLIKVEVTFDNNKMLFYFTADGRIDFRELVKDLAGIFRTRIELRQVGVRDETKLLGGMGICGRPLCCHTYLTDFAPVSIKMAKEQNLSLNPTKISGTCGRLMCCLKNEAETYEYLNRILPGKGDQMTTPDGRHGEVFSIDILRQRIKCIVDVDGDEKEMQEFHVSEISFIPHSKRSKAPSGGQKKEGGKRDRDAQEGRERTRDRKADKDRSAEAEDGAQNTENGEDSRRSQARRFPKKQSMQEFEKQQQLSAPAPEQEGETGETGETEEKRRRRRRRPHARRRKEEGGESGGAGGNADA